ncbi:beta-ketoacyl-[acyl-carrier-protein] synthase family protein [Streptomyces sp. CA-249302]|uniref:beta-ketoacyl-[acyl-carrier-protein] synthase family protein n=1 Tax=Streptomyces sp. CA-249302 TaxID=3240058 RepID=UPI003D92318D
MTRAAVTGIGLVTPAGVGVGTTWRALLAGQSTAAFEPELEGLPVDFCCRVPDLAAHRRLGHKTARQLDRFGVMALLAAREAVLDAGLDERQWDPARIAVVLGVGSNSMATYPAEFGRLNDHRADRVSPLAIPRSIPNLVAGDVSLDLGVTGPSFTVNTACASGATALGVGRLLLEKNMCDIVISGGSDSVCAAMPAACFAQMRALSRRGHEPARAARPFDVHRDGFVLGEGAAVLVLEREAYALARRARIRAHLDGFGASSDAYHRVAPHPDGAGLIGAMRAALADAGWQPQDVDHVSAHATGTPTGDVIEGRALARCFADGPPVTALKGTIGHTVGAAGAIASAVAVLSLEQQIVPPTANLDDPDPEITLDVVRGTPRPAGLRSVLVNSSGFGGQNAVLAFSAP